MLRSFFVIIYTFLELGSLVLVG